MREDPKPFRCVIICAYSQFLRYSEAMLSDDTIMNDHMREFVKIHTLVTNMNNVLIC